MRAQFENFLFPYVSIFPTTAEDTLRAVDTAGDIHFVEKVNLSRLEREDFISIRDGDPSALGKYLVLDVAEKGVYIPQSCVATAENTKRDLHDPRHNGLGITVLQFSELSPVSAATFTVDVLEPTP